MTGPVQVNLGNAEINQVWDHSVNTTFVDANRLAAFSFDPAAAVTATVV